MVCSTPSQLERLEFAKVPSISSGATLWPTRWRRVNVKKMSRVLLISLISTVYVACLGCGRRPSEPTPIREPLQGGQIRIVAVDPAARLALLSSAVARPLTSDDLAVVPDPPDAAGCHRFAISPDARTWLPDATTVTVLGQWTCFENPRSRPE